MNDFKNENLLLLSEIDSDIYQLVHNQNLDIKEQLQFGIKVRINTIEENIIGINKGLLSENSFNLTMNINSLYIHISGILDNLALIINIRLNLKIENKMHIVLRHKEFKKSLVNNHDNLFNIINENSFKQWLNDITNKRDPIAPRKPLYVPPKIIANQEELNKFNQINYNIKNEKNPNNLYSHIIDMKNKLVFRPYFTQYDGSKIYNIEEMITNDIRNLFNIYKSIMKEISNISDN